MNKLFTSAALLAIAATAQNASAEDKTSGEKIKCYGIAQAGKNDCASADGSHSCANQAKADNDKNEWKFADSLDECKKAGGTNIKPANH